jgi:hypothetical protein
VSVEHAWRRGRASLLDAWPVVVAIVVCLPLLTRSGYPLARDLVFVPHQPWTDAVVGLGAGAPRAVPLDALVSVLSAVVDGAVLARIAIPLLLATAGWGVHRLLRGLGTTARLTAGGFAVWNPYVVERLALGQWALLAGYAALPWLFLAAVRFRRTGSARHWGAATAWCGLASITPTGGVLGVLTTLAGGAHRSARTWLLVLPALVLQLPWLVPSLVGPAGMTSDPAGVEAFSAGAEGPGGVVVAVLGLGGIWDDNSVPATRDAWWGTVTALVVVVVVLLGWRGLARLRGRDVALRLALLAGLGVGLALASSGPGGDDVIRWLVENVPGAGLLRDSQKWLAPYAVLAAASLGIVVDAAVVRVAPFGLEALLAVGVLTVPLPLLLLPDGAATVWRTVDPVDYPADFDRVGEVVDGTDDTLATLPWRSYRGFSWGNGLISSDPAVRWFDTDVVTSDDLQVGPTLVKGESPRAQRIGAALRTESVVDALGAEGVRWALVYLDDPDTDDLDLAGLERVYAGDAMTLYSVPDASDPKPVVGGAARALTALAGGLALAVFLGGGSLAAAVRRKPAHAPVR